MDYKDKYLKYKKKYINAKILSGGLTIKEYKNLKYNCEPKKNNVINCSEIEFNLDEKKYTKHGIKYYVDNTNTHSIINDSYNITWENMETTKNDKDNKIYNLLKTSVQNNNIFNNYDKCIKVDKTNNIIKTNIEIFKNLKIIFENRALYKNDFLIRYDYDYNMNDISILEYLLQQKKEDYSKCFDDYKDVIKHPTIVDSLKIITDLFKEFIKDEKVIDDKKFFECLIEFGIASECLYDYENSDDDIVLFSNDLLSMITYYKINENKTASINKNILFIINTILIFYNKIKMKSYHSAYIHSYYMPIQYIIEENKLQEINLYQNKNNEYLNNYFYLFMPSTVKDKNNHTITKNYDLLFNIKEYRDKKWIPIFYNDFELNIILLFNNALYVNNKTTSPIFTKDIKMINPIDAVFNRFDDRLNGNYLLYNNVINTERYFCDFNTIKIYKDKKWKRVKENVCI